MATRSLKIHRTFIRPGTRQQLEIPLVRLPTGTWTSLPLIVVHGKEEGPRLWLTGAIHGDEINGVEIIRQVLERTKPSQLCGTLIAAPVVNVFGFIEETRYMPDRRDLNRCFPGSARGSLAARIANILMKEVIAKCDHGIDIHTSTDHRFNLPHIRADLKNAETRRLAKAFGAPVLLHARVRDGSLREAATERGIHTLLFEGGEPHRFNHRVIDVGTEGILRVMTVLGMRGKNRTIETESHFLATSSQWIRAKRSGILHLETKLGWILQKGEPLGFISNMFGEERVAIYAPFRSIVISFTQSPIIHQGEAIVHLARGKKIP